MFKFFRNIRYQLLKSDSNQKYLTYAFGEILLVVIGILIALQINNWNELRKERNVEQEYLLALHEEFSQNLENLNAIMKINDGNLKNAKEVSKYTGHSTPQISEKEVAILLAGVTNREVIFRSRSGVLDEIISSGKLGIFSSARLRSALSSWKGHLAKVRYQEEELARWRFGLLEKAQQYGNLRRVHVHIVGNSFDLPDSQFEQRTVDLLKLVEFENLLLYFITTAKPTNDIYYANLKNEIDNILSLIAMDLK